MKSALSRMLFPCLATVLWLVLSSPSLAQSATDADGLLTVAESSHFEATSTYDEVTALCRKLAEQPGVRLSSMGTSFEGRDLPLLVISNDDVRRPEDVARPEKLVVFAMGNIHAGEVCGKAALLMVARQLAAEKLQNDKTSSAENPLLDKLVVLLAPIFNADGNERFSKDHRTNQVGPARGMGQRHNAQDLDLNRDNIKLESPEARALAKLITDWQPAICIDTHTTNGSHHQYTITYDGPRHPATPGDLVGYTRDKFLPAVGQRLLRTGTKSFFYGNFNRDHDRWETYPAWPRYCTHYFGLRGTIGVLSEAYSYASYQDRVLATRDFVWSCLQTAAEQTAAIRQLRTAARKADQEAEEFAIESVAVPLGPYEVLGFVEEQKNGKSVATDRQQTYAVEYIGLSRPTKTVQRPFAYVVPHEDARLLDVLDAHGIQLEQLREDVEVDYEVYQLNSAEAVEQEYQGHCNLCVQSTTTETAAGQLPKGTIIVRTDQPMLGGLIVNLLEPAAADGLCAWNFFNKDILVAEQLKPNATFPVWRIPQEVPFLSAPYQPPTSKVNVSSADQDQIDRNNAPQKKRRVTFDTLYGDEAADFSGSPAGGFRWQPDGQHFVHHRSGKLYRIEAATGRSSPLFDRQAVEQQLSGLSSINPEQAQQLAAPGKLRMSTDFRHAIVEHNQDLYALEIDPPRARRLTTRPGKEELTEFAPDGRSVAFVRDYDLYCVDVDNGSEIRLTSGGHPTKRHGKADWVYYEEIYNRRWNGYWWSPDSRHLVVMEYDDAIVRNFHVVDHATPRTNVEVERYPKAGDPIPHVRIGVVAATGGQLRWIPTTGYSEGNLIVTRVGWYPDGQAVYFFAQNRAQTWLDVNRYDLQTGEVTRLFREETEAWVPDPGELHFLADGSFLFRSDRDGWRHLYRYSAAGELIGAVTKGAWEVRSVELVAADDQSVFVTGTQDCHIATNLYRVGLADGSVRRLTSELGSHRVDVAPDGQLFVDTFSSMQHPTKVQLRDSSGSLVRTLDSNPVPALDDFAWGELEYFKLDLPGGYQMPCTLVKPVDFDPARTYPVWLMTYGGPHAPSVVDRWQGGRKFDQLLAELGILAFRCDPRSASGQGPRSTWTAYRQLGVQETRDIEAAVEWLGQLPYVDAQRIGISGHSYGGYLTAYVMTHTDKFAAGIAGAPVTDWRNYDAFYTERYMDTPQENPEGYAVSSVVEAAANLHGRLLLLHGARDDNVHVQNTYQLARALQKANVPFEMMIYPDSRHGIHGRHCDQLRVDFIRRTMLRAERAAD